MRSLRFSRTVFLLFFICVDVHGCTNVAGAWSAGATICVYLRKKQKNYHSVTVRLGQETVKPRHCLKLHRLAAFGQNGRSAQTKTAPEGAAYDYLLTSCYAFLRLATPINKTRCRYDAVICTQNCGAQPAYAMCSMYFMVTHYCLR